MRSPSADRERGSATAELAVALPAVALVLAACLGAVHVVGSQVRLTDAAADAARALGRGESAETAHAIADRVAGRATVFDPVVDGVFVCVRLSATAGAVLAGIVLSAESCAVGGGA